MHDCFDLGSSLPKSLLGNSSKINGRTKRDVAEGVRDNRKPCHLSMEATCLSLRSMTCILKGPNDLIGETQVHVDLESSWAGHGSIKLTEGAVRAAKYKDS